MQGVRAYPIISRSFHTHADAIEWARFTELQADRRDLPASPKALNQFTVRAILERYRDEISTKKRGYVSEFYIINSFLRQRIANYTLAQISTSDFCTYRDKRLKQVKPATVSREIGIIKHAFDLAMREWGIPVRENPLAKIPKIKLNNARQRRLSAYEWQVILEAAKETKNPYLLPLIRLALETGMRRGEMLGIHWKHVNFEARTLFLPFTKNGHSRTIPLTNEAVKILRELQNESKGVKAFPLTGNATRLAWERLLNRTNIHDLHFHDLRHEAISRFFEKGLSVAEVALISGHRDFRMLFRYTHLKAEDVVKKLNS